MATKDITDRQVCLAYQQAHDRFPSEILEATTGQCAKVCYRAMERAFRRGLIDYGTSLRSGWLTAKGLEVLDSK